MLHGNPGDHQGGPLVDSRNATTLKGMSISLLEIWCIKVLFVKLPKSEQPQGLSLRDRPGWLWTSLITSWYTLPRNLCFLFGPLRFRCFGQVMNRELNQRVGLEKLVCKLPTSIFDMPSPRHHEANHEQMSPRATPEEKISRNFNHFPAVDLEAARLINHDGPIQPWRLNRLLTYVCMYRCVYV